MLFSNILLFRGAIKQKPYTDAPVKIFTEFKAWSPNLMWQYFRNRANWLSMSAREFPVVSRNKAAKYSVTGPSILVERRVPPGILVDGKRIRANGWLNPSIMVTSPWATCSLSILFLSSFGSVKAWINL